MVGVPSIGASGAIFGTVAVAWVDLFAHWRYQYRPVRKVPVPSVIMLYGQFTHFSQLMFMIVELVIGIAIGYIPCEHAI